MSMSSDGQRCGISNNFGSRMLSIIRVIREVASLNGRTMKGQYDYNSVAASYTIEPSLTRL